ncbi:hypothetical protein Osc7112_1759 [Oscillatoria nigro-viridis PCC 7112]|uniref:Uncharacterized protein n=1 Tax=Phormidium nigroviride PCC 7112 TaxID=179408 RepID=K9VE86_9CYAN|nr:hypothetical protein Osc7112_1759 [Oscillatoria nigro-viridis PCC 7112]
MSYPIIYLSFRTSSDHWITTVYFMVLKFRVEIIVLDTLAHKETGFFNSY